MAEDTTSKTLFDKIWDAHVVLVREDGETLLWVDRHYVHEGSHHGFAALRNRNKPVSRPDLTFGFADHYVPTRSRDDIKDPTIKKMVGRLKDNAAATGVAMFDLGDRRQGIVHVVGPEQGLTLPGLTVVCGDSHTSTHGAFGTFSFGIGASEVAHVLMTQTLWQRKPKRMRVRVDGPLAEGVGAKDVALSIVAGIGADGARSHVVEYTGSTISGLTMEGRLTLCNLSIEAGARCGMVAPDETTFRYLEGRPYAPKGDDWNCAMDVWRTLQTDSDAAFDKEWTLAAQDIAPVVTWGVSPEDALPITANVPNPQNATNEGHAAHIEEALKYMGLSPGQKLTDVKIDRVFIGSCTNARIEDLRIAAAVLAGRQAKVPGLVSPGSSLVKQQAEQEGLDRIFKDAGLSWEESGCSMCVGMNGDIVPPGERCASTTNRNFKGRQGPGSRTHLMSPAMVATAAVTGYLADARPLLKGRIS